MKIYCANHHDRISTNIRPADSHVSGSPAAQHLCDECAKAYDKKIADWQASWREGRKKHLERRRHSA